MVSTTRVDSGENNNHDNNNNTNDNDNDNNNNNPSKAPTLQLQPAGGGGKTCFRPRAGRTCARSLKCLQVQGTAPPTDQRFLPTQ